MIFNRRCENRSRKQYYMCNCASSHLKIDFPYWWYS